ncbi:MAG TPA: DNA polymerase III subunit delta [Polyangiales bacterium]
MDVHELIERAEQGHFRPVHVIVGSERLFIDRAVVALRKATVGAGDPWNEQVFQGKGASSARILDAARTLPMMGKVRFVLVRAVDDLADKEQGPLADYLTEPSDTTCLVLTAEKLDGRGRLAKTAKQTGCLADAQPIKQAGVRDFIGREARRRKLSMRDDAAAAMADAIGTDLSAIDDALERLSLYVGDGQAITLAAVEACVSRVRVESIWALVDAVGLRDRRMALKATSSLLGDREPPLRILAMVARQLRMIGRMQEALRSGMAPQDAAIAAGAPPFKARDLATAAKRVSAKDLARAFQVLGEADLALKGGKRQPDIVLEGAILELTRGAAS